MFNPCCCSLQRGTKILSIIIMVLMILAIVGLVVFLGFMGAFIVSSEPTKENPTPNDPTQLNYSGSEDGHNINHHIETGTGTEVKPTSTIGTIRNVNVATTTSLTNVMVIIPETMIVVNSTVYVKSQSAKMQLRESISRSFVTLFLATMHFVITLVLAIQLWKGAKERNYWRCNAWFQVQVTNVIVSLISIPTFYCLGLVGTGSGLVVSPIYSTDLAYFITVGVGLVVNVYILLVVHSFMKELKKQQHNSGIPDRIGHGLGVGRKV